MSTTNFTPPDDHLSLMQAFTHAAAGLAITDTAGRFVHLSPAYARLLQLEPEAVSSANLHTLIHPEDRSAHQKLLDKLLAGDIPGFTLEKRYLRADGSSVWVRNSVTALPAKEQRSRHLVHICEDISDRKRLEQAVESQDKLAMIGRLASSIVHEIANPLESARNLLYLAREQVVEEEARTYLTTADEELERVAYISTQTLQFHRHAPQPAESNVAELVDSVLAIFGPRIKAARIEVRTERRKDAVLNCLAVEVRQVIANLIANAVDSMGDGGTIRLRIRPATDWRDGRTAVRVTIADTGTGMATETRPHIYDSFFTTKGAKGSGLGLWVSASIVDRNQGSLHVRSKSGKGTAFTVLLPKRGTDRLASEPDMGSA